MSEKKGKNFLGVLFECCNVYRRIYVNKEKTAYVGRCPYCLRTMKVLIGPDGSDSRFFKAR